MISNPEAAGANPSDLAGFDSVVFADTGARKFESSRLHLLAGILVLLVHAGFWWILQRFSQPDRPREKSEEALLIDFITRLAPVRKPPDATAEMAAKQPMRVVAPRSDSSSSVARIPSKPERNPAPIAPAPQFYNSDGSVRIPADVLADLAGLRGDARTFDFQLPGLERAQALMLHRSPLEYRATRFDKDWRPNQDLLTELLSRAVEASTKEIKIPIPGDSRHHLVCKVSFLAMGGGCGIEDNGDPDALLPGHDDPDTLSASEDKACRAWWEKIITADNQDEWRSTRQLYEQECRKPLAREAELP